MKLFFTILGSIGLAAAQPTICSTKASHTLVHAEGLTERIGDIIYSCTGTPNLVLNVNLSVQLNTAVTNRISNGNAITGTILTVDNGSGPQAVVMQPLLLTSTTIIWDEVPLTFSAQGTVIIQIAGIRANATGVPVGSQIDALLGGGLVISPSLLAVGTPELSLYTGFSENIICEQTGSPLPGNTSSFQSLILDGTSFSSTRITEGWAGAFDPKSAPASLNADTGTRFLIQYSGFPGAAQLFVPNVVAGSDAIQPTAGGDLGVPASGGAYAPSATGSLLLALVAGADSTGAGGTVLYTPGLVGSGTVKFDAMTQLQFVNGTAYAVYEVVDSNPFTLETAQFPTFLGLARNVVQTPVATSESVTLAPVSTVATVSTTAPIPRFIALTPPSDCGIIGDCGASYFPQLSVITSSLQYTLPVGSPGQAQYIPVDNGGAGVLNWTASVAYTSGSGWLSIVNPAGSGNGTIRVDAVPGNLAAGTYQATLTIDGGAAGRRFVAVTLIVTQAPAPVGPQITNVENAATFAQVPVVAGSLSTIMGSSLTGKLVTATFNGIAATIDYSSATQINLLVPATLGSQTSAQLVVTVDGVSSAPMTVQVVPFEPGIFTGGVANQDATPNSVSNPAAAGSEIYFYATGLSGAGPISVRVGTTELTSLAYAGPAPGFPGVQQINFTIPAGLGAITTELYACGNGVCSPPVPLTLK
ncbi:MAG: hypothetical protein ABSF22_09675 [Bryobacteraceae bacterium]